jgi:hypothetical protein
MLIFERERKDGLEEVIKTTASIAFTTLAREINCPVKDVNIKSLASANKDQKDLFYLDTVLVSTGWNQNEDVFLPEPTWAARKTPEDKQFNFMHNENDIIGHITGCYVADRNGNAVNDAVTDIPKDFDIVTESVIYKAWSDPENRKRIEKIIAEIKAGQWYVSMECLFSGFNYAIISPNGEHVLVERNEASAYLSKHLRAYGGAGEYEGYKLGRALTGTSFSGKGLVNKPANPRSIILKTGASVGLNTCFTEEKFTKDLFTVGEKNNMDNDVQTKMIEDLKSQLSKALAANESAQAEAFKKQEEALKQVTAEKAAVVADAEAKIKAAQDENAKLQASLVAKDAELKAANDAIQTIKAEQKSSARLARLVKAGFVEEEAKTSVALYDALDDTAFETIMAKFEDMKKDKEDKKKEKDAEAAKDDKAKKDAEAAKDDKKKEDMKKEKAEDKTEASAETFEDAKATAGVTDVEVDEVNKTRASISDWFGANVLGLTNENGDKK